MPELVNASNNCAGALESSLLNISSTYATLFASLLAVATFVFSLKFYYDKVSIKKVINETAGRVAKEVAEKQIKILNEKSMLLYAPIIQMLKKMMVQDIDIITRLETLKSLLIFVNSGELGPSLPLVEYVLDKLNEELGTLKNAPAFTVGSEEIRKQNIENAKSILTEIETYLGYIMNCPVDEKLTVHALIVKDSASLNRVKIKDFLSTF